MSKSSSPFGAMHGIGLVLSFTLALSPHTAAQDVVFRDGFELVPITSAEASRFLTQASFGPNQASVTQLRAQGYAAWIDAQLALPVTLHRPSVEARIAELALANPQTGGAYRRIRLEKWYDTASRAPDQLRQKMAYALSQILVLSDITITTQVSMVTEYQDILGRNALGNYRNLMEDVTRSPMMAQYLTYFRNPKTEWTYVNNVLTPSTVQPDENYARELMQLFSIGLIERNRDFSPILAGGQTVPTYNQDIITQTARVLTGFAPRCSGNAKIGGISLNRNCVGGSAGQFSTAQYFANPGSYISGGVNTGLVHPDLYSPMLCYPRYSDTGRSQSTVDNYAVLPAPFDRKVIIAGISIPASPVGCFTQTAAANQQACIDYCDQQLDTLLNALFVHPNLPPMIARQLIQRFTTSSPSAAYIDRVAAVFENDGTGERGDLAATLRAVLLDPEARAAPSGNFGKTREPLLKLTALWRAFDVANGSNEFNVNAPESALLQRPLGAPTVFNFYEPDYQPQGELANTNTFAPELQIMSEASAVSAADFFYARVFAGYTTTSATTTGFALPAGAHLPTASIDGLPSDAAALIDELNLRLMYGSMSSTMRSKLIALLTGPMATADQRRKALSAIHLILISPEFSVQR
jgi:uncharacterized protein (DUF1800 family)